LNTVMNRGFSYVEKNIFIFRYSCYLCFKIRLHLAKGEDRMSPHGA